MIAETDHLSDSWFKTYIFAEFNKVNVEFDDPSENGKE